MLMETLTVTRKVAIVKRYSMAHLNRPESVLEHTGGVCLISMLIGLECNKVDYDAVDMGNLLMKATVHDLEESEIGDIANPVKYDNQDINDAIYIVSSKAMKKIADDLQHPILHELWETAKDQSIEGRIVKLADVLSVLAKIYEESKLYSNTSFKHYGYNTLSFFLDQDEIETNQVLLNVIKEAIQINEEIL